MKNNKYMPYLALGITFALFNLIAFVIPTEKTATFWTVYSFTIISFALQIILWKVTFVKGETLNSIFLGISIIHIGIIYLIIQLVTFTVFWLFPILPVRLAVIVCSIILAISVLCVIGGKTGITEINRIDEKVKSKRYFIQSLQIDIEMLAEAETDTETKTALKKLAEKVKFSDPISHETLDELETKITNKVVDMKSTSDKKSIIAEIELLLTERNKKVKILK